MNARFRPILFKPLALGALAGGLAFAASTAPVWADCQEDLSKFMKERDAVIQQLNKATVGKTKNLDPVAACPKFKTLTSILGRAVAYFEKNKEWCNYPDEMIEQARGQRASFAQTAVKACKFAKMKEQMEKQGANGGGDGGPAHYQQKLPTGPL